MASFAAPLSHARALVSRALSCGSRRYHHHHRTSVRASPTNLHYPLHYNHNNDKFQQKKVAGSGHQKVLVAPARLSSPAARTAAVVARAAADDAAGEGGKPRQQPYDAAALLNKSGFLCTVQSGKKDAHRAVEEAKYILTAVDPPPLLGKKEQGTQHDMFGDSLPLHAQGELGCTFLPMNPNLAHAPPAPVLPAVVKYGTEAIENFCSEPLPPAGTPEYLARLVPVERTCNATVNDIVATLENDILPQHFNTHQPNPPKTYYDAYKGPVTFAIHYKHHGKSLVDRAELMKKVGDLLPSPDFTVDLQSAKSADATIFVNVYHEVALLSVLPQWATMQHYNVHELVDQKLREATGSPVQTSGGGGYP